MYNVKEEPKTSIRHKRNRVSQDAYIQSELLSNIMHSSRQKIQINSAHDFGVSRSVGVTKRNAHLMSTTHSGNGVQSIFGLKKFVQKRQEEDGNTIVQPTAQSSHSRQNAAKASKIKGQRLNPIENSEKIEDVSDYESYKKKKNRSPAKPPG